MTAGLRVPEGLDTPALVVFVGVVEENARRLQDELDRRGVALRPHAKTHKSVRIGRIQLEAGARGLTVGTLGEAEVFAAAGFDDLFIAYPIIPTGPKSARLRALHEALPSLRVGADSTDGARFLAAAIAGSGRRLGVLVEVDPGNRRTGVATPEEAADVARTARDAGLEVLGVFAHGGHSYRPGAAEAAAADEVRALDAAADALEAQGFAITTVSAGSTPTMTLAATGRVTEIRAGTYVLGDHQQVVLGAIAADACAAVVAATVVSVHPDRFVVDAGAKSLTKDRPDWLTGFGHLPAYPDAVVDRLSDYHGVVTAPPGSARPALGEVVAIVPNHVCPVVDMFDAFTAVLPDGSIARWPVDARGRSG